MKKNIVLGVLSTILFSIQSRALVADRFKCEIQIKDLETQTSTKQEQNFFVGRLPLSSSPSADIRMTAGQANFELVHNTPKAELMAQLNFYYKHATKVDYSGLPQDARQFSCISFNVGFCEKSGDEDSGRLPCGMVSTSCSEGKDPFQSNGGWVRATLFDGVPTFSEGSLGPVTAEITDDHGKVRGTADLSCQFLGSFQ